MRHEPDNMACRTGDVSAYVYQIQNASRVLQAGFSRVCELEATINELDKRRSELLGQLEDAGRELSDLEAALADEEAKSAMAEGLAAVANARANEMEQALGFANQQALGLAAAIEQAFGHVADELPMSIAA